MKITNLVATTDIDITESELSILLAALKSYPAGTPTTHDLVQILEANAARKVRICIREGL